MTTPIHIKNLTKKFGNFTAVDKVSLEVEGGEFISMLGPSGCGKTTVLRMIAGLETPTSGDIYIDGIPVNKTIPQERGVGIVFQHYALFRHMTVHENIAFGLKIRKAPKHDLNARVDELLELVHMTDYADRLPSQLSGGQRQRVALARALAPHPKVLLLDEPFGALDAKVRQKLRVSLRKLQKDLGVTSVFVTHDQEEAMEIADKVAIMNNGKIVQVGTPQEIYNHPETEFVAQFVGTINKLHGEIIKGKARIHSIALDTDHPKKKEKNGKTVNVLIRPEDFVVSKNRNNVKGNAMDGIIASSVFLGSTVKLEIQIGDEIVTAIIPKVIAMSEKFREGDKVLVGITNYRIFDAKKY